MSVEVDRGEIASFMSNVEAALGSLSLSAEAIDELKAELATTKAQLASPKPKAGIIRSTLGTIRHVLEGATGHMAGTLLAELVKMKIMSGM
jgi:hypothetical protein